MNETYLREHLKERRKAERISFTFPARTPAGIIGETVNLSASGLRLALERPLLSTRTIPIRIDFPFSSPFESHVEIVWNRPESENNRFLCGVRFLKLQKDASGILKEAFGQCKTLNSDFVSLTEMMRSWLVDFKTKCDNFDLMYPDDFDRINFIEKNNFYVETKLTQHFKSIGRCIKNFNSEEYILHQKYYRDMLWFFLSDLVEINRFIRYKPLGYAGDFIIMNYFYDYCYKYLGESSYEKSINFYTCNIPMAFSVVERKDFFKEKILETLRNKDSIKILSIASGSARELTELVEEGKITKPLYFDCLDFETEAFQDIKNTLQKAKPEDTRYLSIRFNNESFMDFIKGKPMLNLFEKYDMIYSSGLFDYLSNRIARKLVAHLFDFLDNEATLFVTNAKNDMDYQAYYEMLGGWKLIHRKEEEVLAWADEIQESHRTELINLDTIKPFMFFILALQKNPVKLF